MSQPENYVDYCLDAMASIDAQALGQLSAGFEIGRSNLFIMRSLGELSVTGGQLHVGLKVPLDSSAADSLQARFNGEMRSIALLVEHMPDARPKVPQLMALLAIEGVDKPVALLTEDATRGGRLPIYGLGSSLAPSDRSLAMRKAFRGVKHTKVNNVAVDHSLAFRVGADERFLDFTPPPVQLSKRALSDPMAERISDLVHNDKLTITISPDSPLSQSLLTT